MFTHPLRYAGASLCALFLVSTSLAEQRLDEVLISASRLTPVADLLPVLSDIEARLRKGELPSGGVR